MSEESNMSIEKENEKILYNGFIGSYNDLLDKLHDKQMIYLHAKQNYEAAEVKLWLNTNFEFVLSKEKVTQKEKEYYVKKKLLPLNEDLNAAKLAFDDWKRLYDIALKYSLEVLR